MSSRPSVKGTLFRLLAADVGKRVANGEIRQEALSRHLEADDLALLERKILPLEWIDVRAFERLMNLMRDEIGNGRDHYLIQCGEHAAESLIRRGAYRILGVLQDPSFRRETGPEARLAAFGEDLRTLANLATTLNNFGSQTVAIDPEHPERYRLEITGAADYPDVMAISNQGFINRLLAEMGQHDLMRWKRVSDDVIYYTMVRPPDLS